MYGILEPPTIATSELHSHLEQQAQSVAPQIELVAATISVERLGLTRNASSTPYIVYRVKERRCCTFFKRKLLWQLMQVMLRAEYGIEDKIRSIISTPDFSLSFFIGSSWQHVLNHQICRFVERANNFSRPEETIPDPVEILVAAMKLAIAKSNWNLVKGEIAAYPEYKAIAWSQLTRDEKQQLSALVPEAIQLAQNFAFLVGERQPSQLDSWLERALKSQLSPFHRFAKRLQEDYDAVKAGITLPWSNGQTEGQINRLKMLKRQMFGRAGMELLSRRFLLAV
jgi:hypothetical protein